MRDINELRQKRGAMVNQTRAILDKADNENRALTAAEDQEYKKLESLIDDIGREIDREERQLKREAELARTQGRQGEGVRYLHSDHDHSDAEYEVAGPTLKPTESMTRNLESRGLIHQPEFANLSLGAVMRSMIMGPRNELERRALAEGADSTGGVSVPDITLSRFVDKLRAATVCIRAGAQTLPLTSDKTTIARTSTDPVCAWRSENAAVVESDPAFEGLVFTPRSLAVYFKVSRELIEDSVNIEQALEASLTGSLSVELDRVALQGSGTPPEPRGIQNTTGVGAVAVTAAITSWDKFILGLYELWIDSANDPTAIVMHPRTLATVVNFKEATTNAPLQTPPVLANIPLLRTTGMSIVESPGTATTVIIGDFTQLILGIRTGLRIEILREAFATNHQYAFVAHMRADIGLQHPQSFCKLTGIVP
jgi:HK97 family phage major capsid protein